jgi:uncharacterized protein (TIGR00369 family)
MTPAALTAALYEGLPLAQDWAVEVVSAGSGAALLRLPANPRLQRPGPTLSGPALMGLADMAMWIALLSETGGRDTALTVTLSTSFLRAAGAGAVLAEARIIRQGRASLYAEVWLRAEGTEKPCAHVTSTWLKVG